MYNQGFKYKEIAEDLNLPIGTIKSRIFLARKKLMLALPDYR
jgi:DNA-directed RNA polymerase specialized sigma24 family protein